MTSGFDFELTLHAVLRYMERHPDIDFEASVDHMGYNEDEFLTSTYADELRELVSNAKPESLKGGQMHLHGSGWVFIVDMNESTLVTCYPL